MRSASRSLAFVVLLLGVSFGTGCDSARSDGDVTFGDAYRVLEQVSTPGGDLLDVRPSIGKDFLNVTVQYAGGCAEHAFEVRTRETSDRGVPVIEVWLVHDDGGDQCEAAIQDSRSLPLPDQVVDAARADLLTPDGTRYRLR